MAIPPGETCIKYRALSNNNCHLYLACTTLKPCFFYCYRQIKHLHEGGTVLNTIAHTFAIELNLVTC